MRSVATSIIKSRQGTSLLKQFPAVQSLSFSTHPGKSSNIDFNVMFFCPRNEKHFEDFRTQYPDFIKDVNPKSISVSDITHHPRHNNTAISSLLENGVEPSKIIPHLVLIGDNKENTDKKIRFFQENGINTIFVARGNPATVGQKREYMHHPQGYEDMPDLMNRIRELSPGTKILVAGYPSKHPFARTMQDDMDELKHKVESGADGIITQHFFNNNEFVDFMELCEKKRITVPIIPSVLPIGNPKYLYKFSNSASVDIPAAITEILFGQEGMTTNSEDIVDKKVREMAVAYTVKQINELKGLGIDQVDRINTYAANNPEFLREVFDGLGIVDAKQSVRS